MAAASGRAKYLRDLAASGDLVTIVASRARCLGSPRRSRRFSRGDLWSRRRTTRPGGRCRSSFRSSRSEARASSRHEIRRGCRRVLDLGDHGQRALHPALSQGIRHLLTSSHAIDQGTAIAQATPSMMRRKALDAVKTGGTHLRPDKSAGHLITGQTTAGVWGA